jgi:hypothetical protein
MVCRVRSNAASHFGLSFFGALLKRREDELFEGHPAVNLGLDSGEPGFLVPDRRLSNTSGRKSRLVGLAKLDLVRFDPSGRRSGGSDDESG